MKQEGLFTITSGLQDTWFVVKAGTLVHKLHRQVNQRPCKKFTVEDGMAFKSNIRHSAMITEQASMTIYDDFQESGLSVRSYCTNQGMNEANRYDVCPFV
jgi:hypothetical protein